MWKMVLATISWGSGRNQILPLIFFPYTFSPFLTITLQRCPSADGDTEAKATKVTELEAILQKNNQSQRCPSHTPSHKRREDRRSVSKETQAPQKDTHLFSFPCQPGFSYKQNPIPHLPKQLLWVRPSMDVPGKMWGKENGCLSQVDLKAVSWVGRCHTV